MHRSHTILIGSLFLVIIVAGFAFVVVVINMHSAAAAAIDLKFTKINTFSHPYREFYENRNIFVLLYQENHYFSHDMLNVWKKKKSTDWLKLENDTHSNTYSIGICSKEQTFTWIYLTITKVFSYRLIEFRFEIGILKHVCNRIIVSQCIIKYKRQFFSTTRSTVS